MIANEAAAKSLGFDLSAAGRKPVDRLLGDVALVNLIRQTREGRQLNRIIDHSFADSDGTPRDYKITLSSLPAPDDSPTGVVAVLHDTTREKEISRLKNDFVANVTHELRTPLASIKAYAEMLIDGEASDNKTRQEFYEVIHTEANRLGRLIDNILNISRIESGLVKYNKKLVSLMVLLKQAVEVIRPQAKQKNITLDEQIAPSVYQTLADKDMLHEVLLNLLSNAVKYTPQGGKITVRSEVDESRKIVTAKIIDTGVGIPQKDLPFVFDKFYRAEANNGMAKGTGLGLSLVKRIIESVHGGKMIAESQPGKGSTFGFELTLAD
jgi:two-component system phosphate regulon sensor histidine kinase PhoR